MRKTRSLRAPEFAGLTIVLACATLWCAGCMGGYQGLSIFGSPYESTGSATAASGPGSTGFTSGGITSGNDRSNVNPCTESQSRRYIRISMRNETPEDYIHYFLVMVAYVYDATGTDGYADGAVCPDDYDLYRANGYTIEVDAGEERVFGNYCFTGPALIYYHESGRFQSTGGTTTRTLASAIGPAQGTLPTYDNFFTSAGAQLPVPNLILFHNPGTGEGANLITINNSGNPCDTNQSTGAANCLRDAWYYVDSSDLMSGTPTSGAGSGRREPNEIQGTVCETGDQREGWQQLAPSGVSAANAEDYEFLRGGRIDYVFIRDDQDPAFPQLVWKVVDERGAEVHDYDARSGVD
ncbi:MAG: hypothetical protein JXO22_14800 [Phycisphaerae bacterium]|nr:hypothetical protein [Phycisphaerae bacterium]